MARIISTDDWPQALSAGVEDLRRGRLIAIPTETVYGLAADATNGKAVAEIFAMKGRPSFNPLICHVDGMVMAEEYGVMNEVAHRLAQAFWPGPLTLVVSLVESSNLHDLVTAGLGSVGLRCPQGLARQIISALGKPLAAPSANRSGRISPTSAAHVASEFPESGLLIVDGGNCDVGLESTIVKVSGNELTLLRPGAITVENIEAVTGLKVGYPEIGTGIEAPGMMASHYAPDAAVLLDCLECKEGDAWLGFGSVSTPQNASASLNLSSASDLREAAANLYHHLKQLDATSAQTICVAPIPEVELGIAINDRLRRAAAPRN